MKAFTRPSGHRWKALRLHRRTCDATFCTTWPFSRVWIFNAPAGGQLIRRDQEWPNGPVNCISSANRFNPKHFLRERRKLTLAPDSQSPSDVLHSSGLKQKQ
jgi:hypothetical protein